MKNNEQGFSLLEVLFAITLFAIGLLATAQMQWTALHGNARSRGITEAATLAQSKIDELRMVPWDSASLTDVTPLKQLDNPRTITVGTTADGKEVVTIYGNVYTVLWNVVDDVPVADAKTVRVFVVWDERGATRRFSSDFVRTQLY